MINAGGRPQSIQTAKLRVGVELLGHRVIRAGSSENMTFTQALSEGDGGSHATLWGKNLEAEGQAKASALWQEHRNVPLVQHQQETPTAGGELERRKAGVKLGKRMALMQSLL